MRQTLHRIPTKFMDWLVSSRIEFITSTTEGHSTQFFAAHLPVMATWSEDDPYPVNLTVKGLGLLPKEELLTHFTDIFESTIAEARTMTWKDSLPVRMEAIRTLYGDPDNFDDTVLGGLEIFGGTALRNIEKNNHASLIYCGMSHAPEGIKYISFQVNSTVDILDQDDQYYRFLLASRKLFEFDKFHLFQPDYPFGYLFRVEEVNDKSPFSRKFHKE